MSRDRLKRSGSSIAAVKASAVRRPTPGIVINRRHASDALTIFFMSASIATTAAEHRDTRGNGTSHGGLQASDALARPERLVDETRAEGARQPNAEHHGKATDLVLEGDPLADQLLAGDDQRADGMCRQ